ncbi:MAG TPA: hypothetical protein PKY12_01785 [Catalimonadaceae bacterium]|nr:hypothetical protein [Catalimonadaceae bacterium]
MQTRLMKNICKGLPMGLFAILMGCAYNSKEKPDDPCNQFTGVACDSTVKYTYSGQINTLMDDQGCNGCHDGNTGDSPKLDTQKDLIAYVSDCKNRAKFEAAIRHTSDRPMPKGADKMSDADIEKFLKWICQGAKP